MNKLMINELIDLWELKAETEEGSEPSRRETLRECADMLRMLSNSNTQTGQKDRESELVDLLTSAHCIAARKGKDVAWERLAASIQALGIGQVTARTYRASVTLNDDPCPDCGNELKTAPGGGVKCSCGYWFCY